MLGAQRIGQDLMNVGARQTNELWHFIHLYDPQSVSPGSVMPDMGVTEADARDIAAYLYTLK